MNGWFLILAIIVLGFNIVFAAVNIKTLVKNFVNALFRSGGRVYIIALAILIISITFMILLHIVMPDFMKWSWLHLFKTEATNVNMALVADDSPLSYGKYPVAIVLIFIIPSLARLEEIVFRHNIFSLWKRIVYSLVFGICHIITGIPLFVALVISFTGFLLSVVYFKQLVRTLVRTENIFTAYREALDRSTAVHSIYNIFILILVVFIE